MTEKLRNVTKEKMSETFLERFRIKQKQQKEKNIQMIDENINILQKNVLNGLQKINDCLYVKRGDFYSGVVRVNCWIYNYNGVKLCIFIERIGIGIGDYASIIVFDFKTGIKLSRIAINRYEVEEYTKEELDVYIDKDINDNKIDFNEFEVLNYDDAFSFFYGV